MTSVFYVKKTLRFTVSIIYFHLTLVLSKYQNNKYQYIKKLIIMNINMCLTLEHLISYHIKNLQQMQ